MTVPILVAGGAGYIGSHTCKALAKAGFRPVVFDNFSTGHRDFVQWGPFVEGDIRDEAAVASAVSEHRAAAVAHFAAFSLVGESVAKPDLYYDNNVTGSLALLRGMRRGGCSRIVFSSTCAVYGQPEILPVREGTATAPVSPYGASKLMVEHILADHRTAYDLSVTCLRYFNACGADPEADVGEHRDVETHLIPRAMMSLQGHIHDFSLSGSDYDTFDGTAVRDYVHVSDLADAHVAALSRLIAGDRGNTYNLGTGQGLSVRQVVEAIEAHTGETLPKVQGPRRPGDPAELYADAALAKRELKFKPRHSDLKTIIATAWAWHRKAHPRQR